MGIHGAVTNGVASAGPLIRIIGDRWVWQVKAAILVTLGGLIAKAGLALKPFVPQLQTSFLKCLNDEVRPMDPLGTVSGQRSAAHVDLAAVIAASDCSGWRSCSGAHLAPTASMQALAVRKRAAENLGALSVMSPRVDALAADLVKNDPAAEPRLREAQLWALRGILLASGGRLTPATVTRVGSQLQAMLSDAGVGFTHFTQKLAKR